MGSCPGMLTTMATIRTIAMPAILKIMATPGMLTLLCNLRYSAGPWFSP